MEKVIFLLMLTFFALGAPPKVNYPVRFAYINAISAWSPQSQILAGLGVPGYAKPHSYNYIAFAFWSHTGPLDIATLWSDPVLYIGASP
jgi:hypothetical protein